MTYSGGRDSASWKKDLFYYLVKDAETTIHMVMNYEFTHRSQVSLKFMMAEINNLSEERKRDRHTSKRKIRQDYKRVDFPGGSAGKESALRVPQWGRPGFDPWVGKIPGLGRSPGGRHGSPLQYSCLENPHGQRSLVGYSPWGHKESNMTEWLSTHKIWHGSYTAEEN